MEATELKDYWDSKYYETFNEPYKAVNFGHEIRLLKGLVSRYNKYLLLEAIDRLMNENKKQISTINFFASKKVFESKFKDLINQSDIIVYKRFFPFFPAEIKDKARELIQEYVDLFSWENIPDSEKSRKERICYELREITNGFIPKTD